MTPSDAQRIERLIEDLRIAAHGGTVILGLCRLCEMAADELARLRVDAARYAWLKTASDKKLTLWSLHLSDTQDEYIDKNIAAEAATAPMRAEKEDGRG